MIYFIQKICSKLENMKISVKMLINKKLNEKYEN